MVLSPRVGYRVCSKILEPSPGTALLGPWFYNIAFTTWGYLNCGTDGVCGSKVTEEAVNPHPVCARGVNYIGENNDADSQFHPHWLRPPYTPKPSKLINVISQGYLM